MTNFANVVFDGTLWRIRRLINVKRIGTFTFSSSIEFTPDPKLGGLSIGDRWQKLKTLARFEGPLLPFDVDRLAWIGTGKSYQNEVTKSGSIHVDADQVTLTAEDGNVIVRASPKATSASHVFGYLGLGFRLDVEGKGSWYIQPVHLLGEYLQGYSLANFARMRRARKVNRRLLDALDSARS